MAEPLYDLFFNGDLLDGFFEDFVKADLKTTFNKDDAYIETLFNGHTHALIIGVERAVAVQYQQGFKKAGAKLIVRQHEPKNSPKPTPTPTPTPTPSKSQNDTTASRSATHHSTLTTGLGAGGNGTNQDIVQHQVTLSAPAQTPSWGVSNVGAQLSEPTEPVINPVNTSHLDLKALGADLLDIGSQFEAPEPLIDTSALSVAPAGEILETLTDVAEPVIVDTQHIRLE